MVRGIHWALGSLALMASGAVSAHIGAHPGEGLAAGLAHPFMGMDHLLAMVAVGVWAMRLGGQYRLIMPATFVAAMALGATAGTYGIALPQVEGMIALSVLVMGLLLALALNTRSYWAVSLVALFALFHGHAHGTVMPELSAPWLYFAGFMLATALLHAIGVAAGSALRTHAFLLRAGGAAIGLTGSWMLFSSLM